MDRDTLRKILADAELQEKYLFVGYSGDEDPMSEVEEVLRRQIVILKTLIAEDE